MIKRIKGTITSFVANRRLSFSCGILFVVLVVSYVLFNNKLSAQSSDCTSSSTINTSPNYNTCNPVLCSSLIDSQVRNPDNPSGYNCYYMQANNGTLLRPCKAFANRSAVTGPLPRENCADLIDLPLCSTLGSGQRPNVNCVREARDVTGSGTRGVTYAVHNVDSVRFCGRVESSCTDSACNDASKCKIINCHQMTASETPNPGNNCSLMNCVKMTLDEFKVSDHRFDDPSKKYCDGTSKCYTFFNNTTANPNNSDNLQYLIYRYTNSMCKIHNCPPDSSACGANDIDNIPTDQKYRDDYKKYINGNMDLSAGLCSAMSCKAVGSRTYRCDPPNLADPSDTSGSGTTYPSSRNSNCDATSTCSFGFCRKTIDCNLSANNNEPECASSGSTSSCAENSTDPACADPFNAWFYRPVLSGKVEKENGVVASRIRSVINNDFCYSLGEMRNTLGWGWSTPGVWWHLMGGANVSLRSPGACGVSNNGNRGLGYGNLCGAAWNLYANPTVDVGYIKGFAKTVYSTYARPKYEIMGCLRYTNASELAVCGARECRLDSHQDLATSDLIKWCGFDECRKMVISDEDIDRCSMAEHQDIFDGSVGSSTVGCLSDEIDGYVRMRARKYGRKICVYLDYKGALSYNGKNFDGKETLADETTCVDGDTLDSNGDCQGKNTNDNDGSASVWRTAKIGSGPFYGIQYIGNSLSGNQRGYVDMEGRFFAEQDCAKVPLRIGPPRFYQVATAGNSKGLFEPPIYIANSRTERGGAISSPLTGELLGRTSFLRPEIEVGFGMVRQKMSLGAGYIGNDTPNESYTASPWQKVLNSITTTSGGSYYEADLFVKKEYSERDSYPVLCLYRRITDPQGVPIDPIQISCAKRNKPEISSIYSNRVRMNVSIVPDSTNLFNNVKMKFKIIYSFGANNLNDGCTGDDVCSREVVFTNPNHASDLCSTDIDAHKICSKREACSQLTYECPQNEIDLHSAIINGQPTASFETVKAYCNGTLLQDCNRKFGILDNNSSDFFSQINNFAHSTIDPNYQNFQSLFLASTQNRISVPNRYGWFSEMCITQGFESKYKNIIAYKTVNGVPGRCIIDATKSAYLNDLNSATNCDAGGKAPYCVCVEAVQGEDLGSDYEVRKETPREAGLCMDMPIPKFCQAIDYTSVDGPTNDPNYTASSVVNSVANKIYSGAYSDANGVHTSHQNRTTNTSTNGIVGYNHAEYSAVLGGTSTVYGACNGFWTEQVSGGNILRPTLNCKIDGTWELPDPQNAASGNPCVYKVCPAVSTGGAVQDSQVVGGITYQNNYSINESGDEIGRANGYALWLPLIKSNDYLQSAQATACIVGFKPAAGGLPTRYCKQDGVWQQGTSSNSLNNQCQRIMCPAIKKNAAAGEIDLPDDALGTTNRNAWDQYGGAEFNAGKASRSDSFVPAESIVSGTCNTSVGFFKGLQPDPTLKCNSQGQWEDLQNRCQTTGCGTITNGDASQGNASWPNTDFIGDASSTINVRGTCNSGFVVNPYVSESDKRPKRVCQAVFNSQTQVLTPSWGTVSNSCINQCPGGSIDTVNGMTSHQTYSSGGTVTVNWPSTALGTYAYYSSGCSNASQFQENRTNGCYRLRRFCNSNGSWSTPEAMCIANGGTIGNATYTGSAAGVTDAQVVGGSVVTGACVSGYWKYNNNSGSLPQRQCVSDGTSRIDRVYWALANGTNDCEQKKCYVAQNTNFANLTAYTGTSGYYDYNANATLSCRSGKYFDSGSLTVTCGFDGQWNAPNGSCREPRTCDYTASTITMTVRKKCNDTAGNSTDCCNSKTYNARDYNQGATVCYNTDGDNGGGCTSGWSLAVSCRVLNTKSCDDGTPTVTWGAEAWQ